MSSEIRQPKWDIYEAVILLDGFLEMENGNGTKQQIVKRVSAELRQMGQNRGIEISDVYRNVNGISFQMASMESAYLGKTISKPATLLFSETVKLYRENQNEYTKLLREAKAMVEGKKTIEDQFITWLTSKVSPTQLSELYLCYPEIEQYCLKIKILRKPLFETTDLATVKRAQKTVTESRLFQLAHKKQMKKIVAAAQFYTAFIKEQEQLAEKQEEVRVQELEQPVTPKTAIDETRSDIDCSSSSISVDFENIKNLAYTRPIKVSYFDEEIPAPSSWTDAYVKLFSALYEDYADVIPVGKSFFGYGRPDFGDEILLPKMTAPKHIASNLFLETNVSATDIVKKIRALLDICNVDFDNVIIEYESKEKSSPSEVQDNKQSFEPKVISGVTLDENAFFAYLRDDLNMAEATCRSYTSAIRRAERFAADFHYNNKKLYKCSFEEAQATFKELFADSEFLEFNEQQHNRFRAAITKLLEQAAPNASVKLKRQTNIVSPKTEQPQYNTAPFEKVLEEHFVRGFRIGSALDLKKFRRYYEETHNEVLDKDDSQLTEIIRNCGIVYEDKVFLPKTMLSEEVKRDLLAHIEESFQSGKTTIYYEALFKAFSEAFLDHYIYNAEMLRAYLDYINPGDYLVGRNYVSKEEGEVANPVDEVRLFLKNYGGPIETDHLCKMLAHLPKNNVVAILGSNLEFVRNSKGEYFHADILNLSEEELENIAELIEDSIKSHHFISGTELMNAIRSKYPRTYEGYSSYSDLGWRDALKYKFGGRFTFKGNIISASNSTLSMSDVFGNLAASREQLTMDEIMQFAEEMGTVPYFDAVYDNALRISEKLFVSKSQARFNVKDTDAVLGRFCTGNYIPIKDIQEFGIFPDAGFTWTSYLLESYAAYYSEKYTLIHGGYNRNYAVGVIAKKSAGYTSFDDVVEDALAHSGIALKKANALDYLAENGYIARRSYANIEELIIRANAQRNGKGRP